MVKLKIDLPNSFYEEEKRLNYTITKNMKEVWAVELDLLLELDRVCNKYNLKYFADGGTLLGAVRHGGFIPWDDDIDIVMLREDYDKLIHKYCQEFKKPYFMQSAYTDVRYPRPHAQLRNSQTCAILKNEIGRAYFNQGIFIDIFPLDGVTLSDKELTRQVNKIKRKKRVFSAVCMGSNNYVLKLLKNICFKLYPYKQQYFKFEKLVSKNTYNDTGYVDALSFRNDVKKCNRFSIDYYNEMNYVKFETIKVPIPAGYNEILKRYYGDDYMVPQKICTMHGGVIFDTSMSYLKKDLYKY